MSSSNLVRLAYKKESSYGVKVDATKASKILQDLTYTALKGGEPGNLLQIQYATGGTAGAEVVLVTGNLIKVTIQSGTSTATQVRAAVIASTPAMALLSSVVVSGSGATAQVTASAVNFTGGLNAFNTARFTSEKYSGTPDTTTSAQIRTDRMSSGQVVTGLKVDGGHAFELAKEAALEDFMASAMLNTWSQLGQVTVGLTIDATAQTITRGSGSFINEGVVVGDIIVNTGFTAAGNNVPVMAEIVTDLVITYAGPTGMANGTGVTTKYQRADKLTIGIAQQSFSVEKTFLDLTTKAIIYKGVVVNQMQLDVQYGSLISGSFDTNANDYETADMASEFMSYGEYINSPATSDTLNGSVDMPFITTNVTGSFDQGQFCLQSLKLSLNNNNQAQTCIGKAAPEAYSPGTADIKVDLSSYLKDSNWALLQKKLDQSPFAIGFMVNNVDGWYGFFMPAIQVSFDDPQSGGANQQISMNMSGTAKVGSNSESALSIYRLPA